jgi:hypothetical protein
VRSPAVYTRTSIQLISDIFRCAKPSIRYHRRRPHLSPHAGLGRVQSRLSISQVHAARLQRAPCAYVHGRPHFQCRLAKRKRTFPRQLSFLLLSRPAIDASYGRQAHCTTPRRCVVVWRPGHHRECPDDRGEKGFYFFCASPRSLLSLLFAFHREVMLASLAGVVSSSPPVLV